jgi:uncharacterized membrane protein YcaP (DUF421 family)
MCVCAYCFSINLTGVVAVALDIDETTMIVNVLAVVIAVVLLGLYWSGVIGTNNLRQLRNMETAVIVVLGGIIICGVVYMGMLHQVLYVMLTMMALMWLLMFAALWVLRDTRKRINCSDKQETPKENK